MSNIDGSIKNGGSSKGEDKREEMWSELIPHKSSWLRASLTRAK